MSFACGHAQAGHWGLAVRSCLEQVVPAVASHANVGFVYVGERFADDLPSVLTFLRETSRIQDWVGAVVPGIVAQGKEMRGGDAMAVMVGRLPAGSFRPFSSADLAAFSVRMAPWIRQHGASMALVHGNPRDAAIPQMIATAADGAGFLAGGLVSATEQASQVAGSIDSGALSGLLLGQGARVVTGLSQGCSPLGGEHMITEAWDAALMSLDYRPAIDVLKDEAGELIARDLKRAAGYIHVALPVQGSDTGDYQVRSLLGIDPRNGWLVVGDQLQLGRRLMFVRRDPQTAKADLTRMLESVVRRLDGRKALAAHYVTCTARGEQMFGEAGLEAAMVQDALGPDVPLIGFFANGEISGERLYTYTAILTVLAEG
jgi:small ligand-binding sensory domain FIST